MSDSTLSQQPKIETFDDLCSAVYFLRVSRGMSGVDLAKKVGVSPATVSNLEHGKTCPRSPSFERIMVCLGIDLEVATKIAIEYHQGLIVKRFALERMVPDAPMKSRFKEVKDAPSEG